MDIHPQVVQIIGALWTVFIGVAISYMKNSERTRKEISESLKRLEILFEVKIPRIEKQLEDHDSKISQLHLVRRDHHGRH